MAIVTSHGKIGGCGCECNGCCAYHNGTGSAHTQLLSPGGACEHANPTLFSLNMRWDNVQATEGGAIPTATPIVVGGLVTLTLGDEGGGIERRTSPNTYSGDFCLDYTTASHGANTEALAFFRTSGTPPTAPGGPATIDIDAGDGDGVCAIAFAVQQDGASLRGDFFIEYWLDGVYEGVYSSLFVDSTSPGSEAAPTYGVAIAGGTTKRITKIRFGFADDGHPPFAIGTLGICL